MMSLKNGLAATLRTIRAIRRLPQSDLAGAIHSKYLYELENGLKSVTLDKLLEVSQALNLHPVTLLTIAATGNDDTSIENVLDRVRAELQEFERAGGVVEFSTQLREGVLAPSQGKKTREPELAAVQACKTAGMTQRATAAKLGMPKSTVADLWNRETT